MNGSFKEKHLRQPIGRFAIGTWAAGTSTLIVVEIKNFGGFQSVAWLFVTLNAALWVFYLYCSYRSTVEVTGRRLFDRVHGVVLLSAVSTQAMVLMISAVFQGLEAVSAINKILVVLGIVFYIAAAGLVGYRYLSSRWNLSQDWNNTNCMLHGAASISGAAALQAHVFSNGGILSIWIYALVLVLLVEGIEIGRACDRIRRYGWSRGIWKYDVSQWTRIFTLGMFYFFTMKSQTVFRQMHAPWLSHLRTWVVVSGVWVIVVLLIAELAVLLMSAKKTLTAS
jgi:hypothetical protein